MTRTGYGLKEFMQDPVRHFVMPLLVEFLSQFIFTFWGVMTEKPQVVLKTDSVAYDNSSSTAPNRPTSRDDESDYLTKTFVPAFQSGIAVWLCIMLHSKISHHPAQFNPAITTTFVVVGTVPALMLLPNITVQCLSSLLAAFASQLIRGAPPPALIIPEEMSSWAIFFNEVIMVASVTIFVAELTQNPNMKDPLGAFGVGMAVFMCLLSGAWTGVVCISTSRVFGPAVLTGGKAWNRHWLLWVSDLTGATVAGVFWLLFLAPPDRSWLGRLSKKNESKTDILMEERKINEESD